MPLPTLQEKQNQNRSILAQAMLQRMVVTDSLRKLEANNSILGSMNHHGNQARSLSSSDARSDIASLMASRTATSIPMLSAVVLAGPDSLLQHQQKLINDLRLRKLLKPTVPTVPTVPAVPTHHQDDVSTSQALHLMSQNGKASINHCMFSKKHFDETKLRMSAMVRATPSVTKAGRPSTLSGIRPSMGSITKVPVRSSAINSSIAGLQPLVEHKKARIQSSTVDVIQQHRQVELLNVLRKQNMLRQSDMLKQLQDRQQTNQELQNQQRLAMLVNELQQQKKQQEETQQILLLLQQKQCNVQQLVAQKKEQRNRSASEDQAKVTKPKSAFEYYFQDEYSAFLKEISNSSVNEEVCLDESCKSSKKRKRDCEESSQKSINMELLEKLVRDRWDALEQTKSPKLRVYRIKEMKDIERYRAQIDEIKRKKIEFFNQSQRRTPN